MLFRSVSPSNRHSPQKKSGSAVSSKINVEDMIVSAKKKDFLVRAPMDRLREEKRKMEENEE